MVTPGHAPNLHVVWYRSTLMDQFGGAERVMIEGLRCFAAAGAEATLLLHERLSSETGEFFAARCSNITVMPGFSTTDTADRRPLSRLVRHLRRIGTVRKTMAMLKPDVIIADSQTEGVWLWLYSLGGIVRLPPIATFIHGSPFQFTDEATKYAFVHRRSFGKIREADPVYRELIPVKPPAMALWTRLRMEVACAAAWASVRMSRLVFVLSNKNLREVKQLYGVDQVAVVCPGGYGRAELDLPTPHHRPAALRDLNGPVLLTVSRLVPKKRVDFLIHAFARLVVAHPDWDGTFIVAGAGVAEGSLRELASTLGVEQRVRFVGFIPDEELRDWYGACDLFLSADNADYDLTVMAALPLGKPVVVTTQYEIPAHLQLLRRLFFVSAPTPDAFADAIARALRTPVRPLAGEDREELRTLTWESYFAEILSRCRLAISAGRARHTSQPPAADMVRAQVDEARRMPELR